MRSSAARSNYTSGTLRSMSPGCAYLAVEAFFEWLSIGCRLTPVAVNSPSSQLANASTAVDSPPVSAPELRTGADLPQMKQKCQVGRAHVARRRLEAKRDRLAPNFREEVTEQNNKEPRLSAGLKHKFRRSARSVFTNTAQLTIPSIISQAELRMIT